MAQFERSHPSGAEALVLFSGLFGTAEAVPFQNKSTTISKVLKLHS